jgi:hypothetical protein
MADELAALRKAIDTLPADVTAALRGVARDTSGRVKTRAEQILDSRTDGKASRIAAISVVEDAAQKQFLVIAEGAADKPANLALWFERGTRHMAARPFMRPAGDAETERYQRDAIAAAAKVAEKLER